jgi:hypothetical protein
LIESDENFIVHGLNPMTALLEQAISRIQQLPEDEQNAMAEIILAELEDESRWDAVFAKPHDLLERMAAEAEEEDRAGITRELDPNDL